MIGRCPVFGWLTLLVAACATPASQSQGLFGSKWRFVMIDGEAPTSSNAALEFGERLNATLGCSTLSGPWSASNGELASGPMVRTRMTCDVLDRHERSVSVLLSNGPVRMTVTGDTLKLASRDRSAVLARVL